jgi:hypothetical protein
MRFTAKQFPENRDVPADQSMQDQQQDQRA